MNMVKRKGTTKAKVMLANTDKLKVQFLSNIQTIVSMEDIPAKLLINLEQSSLKCAHMKLDI